MARAYRLADRTKRSIAASAPTEALAETVRRGLSGIIARNRRDGAVVLWANSRDVKLERASADRP